MAQSCLELHSDAHRFNDISEHYSDKELNKTELVCNSKDSSSKSKKNSVASIKSCDQNDESSKSNEQNKTKTESSILNEDLSNKEPVPSNSNSEEQNKQRSITKELDTEELNDQVIAKVQEMVESIVNNDIFDSVFNFCDEVNAIPKLDQSENNLEDDHDQAKDNLNEKPKMDEIDLELGLDMNISTGPLDSSITSVESSEDIIEELVINYDALRNTSPEQIEQLPEMNLPKQINTDSLLSIKEQISSSNNTLPTEKSLSNAIQKENLLENLDKTCSSTDTTSTNTSLPQGISRGEVLPQVLENLASEGEFYQGSSLATTVQVTFI